MCERNALTKFFNLSNIQPVSRRSPGMVRTSQCFRTEILQLDGPLTRAAVGLSFHLPVVPSLSLCGPPRSCILAFISQRNGTTFCSRSTLCARVGAQNDGRDVPNDIQARNQGRTLAAQSALAG